MEERAARRLRLLACMGVILAVRHGASAALIPPPVRALELPAGILSLSASDPLLAPILNGATSTLGSQVTNDQAGQTLSVGKTLVTWRDPADNTTLSRYVYLYRHGWQVLGWASNLRVFEHNGARHILYDDYGRVHLIYDDGINVWYRFAVRVGMGLEWQAPFQLNDYLTPIVSSSLGPRGQTFALFEDAAGNVVLQCVWCSRTGTSTRQIMTRRLTVDPEGNISAGQIIDTNLSCGFPCIVVDSAHMLHLAGETGSGIAYRNSTDGITWGNSQVWYVSSTGSGSYRFVSLAVDSKDRIHAIWQCGGYLNISQPSWWVTLYMMRDAQTGAWSTPVNILDGIEGWQAPLAGQQTLSAYPCLMIDDRDNLHAAWHGTARSHVYAEDDVYYLANRYNPVTDSWDGWSDYTALHKRVFPGTTDGEDDNYSWVPSLAFKAGTDDIYAVFMYGLGDDEVPDASVNYTEGGLKQYVNGAWLPSFEPITQTDDLRSWYPNTAPQVVVDPTGRTWLDVVWIDGTLGDYNIIFRRLDLGGGPTGDTNNDGYVNVGDLQQIIAAWASNDAGLSPTWNPFADLNKDGYVNVGDLQILAANWGQ